MGSILSHQTNLGPLIAEEAGLTGIETCSFEAAGASGGMAFRQACLAVQSGMSRISVALGVEKMTETTGNRAAEVQNMTLNYEYETSLGVTTPAQEALLARRYLAEYNLTRDALDSFAANSYGQAKKNPNAMYHINLSPDKLKSQVMNDDPLGIFNCSVLADGAAAIVVAREDSIPKEARDELVTVCAGAASTEPLSLHDRHRMLQYGAAGYAAGNVFRLSGLLPDQIDLWELWDAYSIDLIISREAIGLALPGHGWELDHRYYQSMGGCQGRGNPLGASGVYQLAEAALQLEGRAGNCQIQGCKTAFVQCLGGTNATAVCHILRNNG